MPHLAILPVTSYQIVTPTTLFQSLRGSVNPGNPADLGSDAQLRSSLRAENPFCHDSSKFTHFISKFTHTHLMQNDKMYLNYVFTGKNTHVSKFKWYFFLQEQPPSTLSPHSNSAVKDILLPQRIFYP